MNESFPFSILSRCNDEPYGLTQLVSDSSECDERTCLGKEFVPGEWDVICGRGKRNFDHVGNRRFRVIVAMNLTRYVEAKTRTDKSTVVNNIVDQIWDASQNGGFVKINDLGLWYVATTPVAREKVAHAIRDCITAPLRRKSKSTDGERRSSLKKAQDAILQTCLRPCKSRIE